MVPTGTDVGDANVFLPGYIHFVCKEYMHRMRNLEEPLPIQYLYKEV